MLEIGLSEAMLAPVSRVPANRSLWSVWSKVFADPQRGDAIPDDICHARFPRAGGGVGLDTYFAPIGRLAGDNNIGTPLRANFSLGGVPIFSSPAR